MRKSTQERKRRKRKWLFDHQKGLCYWCHNPMRIIQMPAKAINMPLDLCTLDHLDDRFSSDRGKHPNERRIVAACWKCNFDRSQERERNLPKEVLWERSKRHPEGFGK